MGSFNETCALSGIVIDPGTPVKMLFLTKNPYTDSDQHFYHRGVCHKDHWYVRTPPFDAIYDDYGRSEFKENAITKLICDLFDRDVLELPFGFNQYHTPNVSKFKGIYHYLQAASSGRLLVKDEEYYNKDIEDSFPTWQKIHDVLRKCNLSIQMDSDGDTGQEGYNAQPVMRGVCCVSYKSYQNTREKLKIAQDVLFNYDSHIVSESTKHDYNLCLIVVPKGAFENNNVLYDKEKIEKSLEIHPSIINYVFRGWKNRTYPTMNVMVRKDVWDSYCEIPVGKGINGIDLSVNGINDYIKNISNEWKDYSYVMSDIPFQTLAWDHLSKITQDISEEDKNIIIKSCAELAHVEIVMSYLHQSWQIPTFGGQELNWKMRAKLVNSIAKIIKQELKKERNHD